MSRLERIRAVVLCECRLQRREPLTALYALVLFSLAFGFMASSAVELVRGRGDVPKSSDWSVMLAFGGLTAFAQVITTMVVVTAVLRDEGVRIEGLMATTQLSPRERLAGQLVAAVIVLTCVYLAMPLGAWVGAISGGVDLVALMQRLLRAYVVLTLPSMLVVASVVGVTAALSRRPMASLAASLLLLGCWQLALSLAGSTRVAPIGVLLDPFGNVPVLVATAEWTDAARAVSGVPIAGGVLRNRAVWIVMSAVMLAVGFAYARAPLAVVFPSATGGTRARSSRIASVWRFTASWISRDGAWRAVTALAVANALINATVRWSHAAPSVASLAEFLDLVREHARIFLILLATVYAGEIVWRDRDVRVNELVDSSPITTAALAWSRLAGLASVQWRAASLLVAGALLAYVLLVRTLSLDALLVWAVWAGVQMAAPFLQWGVLSVAVHVLVRHKVAAHLLLITGWVVAVVLNQHGASDWWYRYAEPANLLEGGGLAWTSLVVRGVYWTSVATLLTVLIVRQWPRGTGPRGATRRSLTSPR